MIILGIESTCDETAAAVVTSDRNILANVLHTQIATHECYGGVVPEVAARAHLEKIGSVVEQAMAQSGKEFTDLDGIAATAGPGLIGGVHVGVTIAKAICAAHNLPFFAINHLAAHALTVRLTHGIEFPYLLLLVSGGHTQLLICYHAQKYELLGTTIDDALGEAFDKTARLMDLPYPGGPEIERLAQEGNSLRFDFPKPLLRTGTAQNKMDFSFSGLKTAVRQTVNRIMPLDRQTMADIAASFQYTVEQILVDRCQHALTYCREKKVDIKGLVIAGGVAANQRILEALKKISHNFSVQVIAPPIKLCTDNAAMVAWAGIEKSHAGLEDTLDFEPRPRWPLAQI